MKVVNIKIKVVTMQRNTFLCVKQLPLKQIILTGEIENLECILMKEKTCILIGSSKRKLTNILIK